MIYDCFTFYNELDLLELRLKTLDDVVDRFVLVESTRTHTNKTKPLYFNESKSRFAHYSHKIEHIIVDDNPEGPDPWVREQFQRDAVIRGLKSLNPNDLVLLSDLDEIWNPDSLPQIRAATTGGRVAVCEQHNCYYFINTSNGYWHGTRAIQILESLKIPLKQLRYSSGIIIHDGGWHISFTGGPEAISKKLQAYAHQEYNTAGYANLDRVAAAISTGADLFSRGGGRARLLRDKQLPKPVQANKTHYQSLLAQSLITRPVFHENWYHMGKIRALLSTFVHAKALKGRVIEIGCWEGKSTSFLARSCRPDTLHAVDTWGGCSDEHPEHPSVIAAQQRDVYHDFLRNMFVLTKGNFQAHKMRSLEYLASDRTPVKFCHLDASHDYQSVKAELEAILPLVVSGGILCGDDFENASMQNTQPGMDGGVERAVRELLVGFRNDGNFWWWRKDAVTPPLPSRITRLRRRFNLSQLKSSVADKVERFTPGLYHALQDWWWRHQARKRMRTLAKQKLNPLESSGGP
jgi:beta-1,4-mannosyl-glycoprotein beta-1,4-N-acetylglucosaminyltransferase